jgi:hypothetical protein
LRKLQQPVGKGAFAVVNVGDNAEVPDVFHRTCPSSAAGLAVEGRELGGEAGFRGYCEEEQIALCQRSPAVLTIVETVHKVARLCAAFAAIAGFLPGLEWV